MLIPSLYLLLSGNTAVEPIVAISSLIAFAGVLLFAVIIFSSSEASVSARVAPTH